MTRTPTTRSAPSARTVSRDEVDQAAVDEAPGPRRVRRLVAAGRDHPGHDAAGAHGVGQAPDLEVALEEAQLAVASTTPLGSTKRRSAAAAVGKRVASAIDASRPLAR